MGSTSLPSAHADEAYARDLLQAMSVYLAAQTALSFNYDVDIEVVTIEDQKLAIASSGSVTLNRPDRIRATRSGGFADVEMAFDGRTLTLLGKSENVYVEIDTPGTVDHLVDILRDEYGVPLPAADLLLSDVHGALTPLIVDVKDLGVGIIRGVACDHLAFRTDEADFQIWIAQGDHPSPCRYVITTTAVTGWPQYNIDVRDWRTGTEVAADDFTLPIPADAARLTPDALS
ncbi:MAG TPA: DUF2092 domain-containing protein, partial [Arenibaculum sp.]|nr:DUF2092 domain-containing protein [Arenibaculum sp.]